MERHPLRDVTRSVGSRVLSWVDRPVVVPLRGLLSRLVADESDHARVDLDGRAVVQRTLERITARHPAWAMVGGAHLGGDACEQPTLMVGPAGVLVIDVQEVPGASVWVQSQIVKVNGTSTPYVRRARAAAARASAALTLRTGFVVPVWPLVVFAQAEHFTIKHQPDDVTVLVRDQLAVWIKDCPLAMVPSQVRAVRRAAENPRTWN